MLAEADTIQKAKDLKDLALTAADWAKRKGLGEEAIQHAKSYALRAEIKMGEMLAATERKTGGDAQRTRLRKGTESPPTLREIGVTKRESMNAQRLAAMPKARQEAIIEGNLTRDGKAPHVSNNSGNNEWYTPGEYIEAARSAMGGIDCDPASTAKANETVKAKTFYTAKQNGLKQKWGARVWMNPPYAQPLVSEFSEALSSKVESGEVKTACVLVNNSTDSLWFHRLISAATAVCFPKGRVRFFNAETNQPGAPLQGQAVIYFGDDLRSFKECFERFGVILKNV